MSFVKGSESSQSLFTALYTLTDIVNRHWWPVYEHSAGSRAVNTILMRSGNIMKWKQGATNKHERIKTSVPGRPPATSLPGATPSWRDAWKVGVWWCGRCCWVNPRAVERLWTWATGAHTTRSHGNQPLIKGLPLRQITLEITPFYEL